jgi:hypothetical protein
MAMNIPTQTSITGTGYLTRPEHHSADMVLEAIDRELGYTPVELVEDEPRPYLGKAFKVTIQVEEI